MFTTKKLNIIISVLLIICLALTGSIISDNVFAASEQNGLKHTKIEKAEIIFFGEIVDEGDGFCKSYRYLTKTDIDSITDEESAKNYFDSENYGVYISDRSFSGVRKGEERHLQKITKGLDLQAVGDAIGVDTTSSPSIPFSINTIASDGYSQSIPDPFIKTRYLFDIKSFENKGAVNPALAFEAIDETDENSSKPVDDIPKIMIGQTNGRTDYNMQYWCKLAHKISFGEVLPIIKGVYEGTSNEIRWSFGDLLGGKSGLYESVYEYTDGTDSYKLTVKGVPLDKMLEDKKIDLGKVKSITMIPNGTSKITKIEVHDAAKYFIATDGTISKNSNASQKIDAGGGDIMLFGPGNTRDEVIRGSFKNMNIETRKPGLTSLAASSPSYNTVNLTWSRLQDVDGYYIDRYDYNSRKWSNYFIDVESPAVTSYTDRNLKTNVKYTYRIRGYRIDGNSEIEGPNSKEANATPKLSSSKQKKLKKNKKKRSVTLRWSKVSGANGYQIYRATKKKGKFKKIKTIKKQKVIKWTNKKLKKGKRYFYKIRAYKNVDGKKVYSSFSAVRNIRL